MPPRPKSKDKIEQHEDKPPALQVIPVGIPQPLRLCRQWIAWKYERRQDGKGKMKWTKVPVNPRNGRNARSNEPATWGTFDEAYSFYLKNENNIAGIGFVFSPDDPFCGVDLDDCRDLETGSIHEWAARIVGQLASYAELSPSGTGLKIFVRGVLPDGRKRRGPIEIYDRGRYFAVTGHHLPETPHTAEERQAELQRLQQSLSRDPLQNNRKSSTETKHQAPLYLTDQELIEKAKNANNGEKFSRLWSGDISGYSSHSEADQALCSLLGFWTGSEPARVDALFRQSGLYRDKWERPDYRTKTIQNALAGRTEFYSGNGHASRGGTAPKSAEEIHLTDAGNAKRLVRSYGADLRYCHPWGKWLVWDGRRWLQDVTAAVTYRAKKTIAAWFAWAHTKIGEIAKQLEEAAHEEIDE
jgi:putative DNA primase/helicase